MEIRAGTNSYRVYEAATATLLDRFDLTGKSNHLPGGVPIPPRQEPEVVINAPNTELVDRPRPLVEQPR
ncbi:hypothetical protein [Amycolatopsis sp. H20-H5]|uniref:hypothetical protein n=1 Tax=Amycolatopsis sp. H20-H5 TaxID=3046309 RepID=UPI002DBF5D8F|nr:hypothetical protein [Amycolatopsis sp. H20-H5]MEC3979606.1 hypothetical protein [Amycolatopsis sp. H20-H5]